MKKTDRTLFRLLTVLALSGLMFAFGGCGQDEEPVAEAPPPPPPSKPRVTTNTIEDLMAAHNITSPIEWPEEYVVGDNDDRLAVLNFFDALARGDQDTFSEMLSDLDRRKLSGLTESGEWDEMTGEDVIWEIMLQAGPNPNAGTSGLSYCVVAVAEFYDPETGELNYQPMMWYFGEENGAYEFEAAQTPPNMMQRLAGTDFISAWHSILEEEQTLASKDDVVFIKPKRDYGDDDRSSGSSSSGGEAPPGGLRPSSPSSPGRRPIDPPPSPF